ncbi:MAG: nickel pincer cofactor biosynthesis protein LarB [Candidatus Bathyarchaeia archaeon]
MRKILEKLYRHETTVDEAERLLKLWSIGEIEGIARLDVQRETRRKIPEIILGEGKDSATLTQIISRMLDERGLAIVSKASKEQIEAIKKWIKGDLDLKVSDASGTVVVKKSDYEIERIGKIGVITAGTADIPVAEEAKVTAEALGCGVITAYDVGVAGVHRLFAPLKEMIEEDVDAIIVVAGMEGALPSLVAGLVDVPVIGVPASSGYGLGGKGISALLSMLHSCPLGLTVVNIGNGVGAAASAVLIANKVHAARKSKHQQRS